MAINRLSDHVINLIAAGEVVERPVAVIRELIDNSLDAGSTKIGIELIDGGLELIRVTDNGTGMSREDALLAFERHATSKLSKPSDLEKITTLGFRGEALASIAAVSKVRLLTRRAEAPLGTEISLAGGGKQTVATCAAPVGTTVEVRSLFFNQPARRKFMKLPRTELAKIKTHINAIALVTPHVHISIKVDGKEEVVFAPASSIHARARGIWNEDLLSVSGLGEVLRVEGGVTHPGTPQKTAITTIVNGRVVQDRMLLRAIREGYDSMLKSYELPGGFISLNIRADLVDVNVHPQKSEVRFRDSSAVFVAVKNAVRSALSNSLAVLSHQSGPKNVAGTVANVETNRDPERRPQVFEQQTAISLTAQNDFSGFIRSASLTANAAEDFIESKIEARVGTPTKSVLANIKLVGQVLGCYLIGEDEFGLVAIDMHAAHERINFNRIRSQMLNRSVPVQELLFPIRATLSEQEGATLEEREDYFKQFGFRWESLPNNAVQILSAPAFIRSDKLVEVFTEALSICGKSDYAQPLHELIDSIAARLACHASIRGGDIISERESYALLAALDEADSGGACPHGRPVIRRFDRSEVETWFGRDR